MSAKRHPLISFSAKRQSFNEYLRNLHRYIFLNAEKVLTDKIRTVANGMCLCCFDFRLLPKLLFYNSLPNEDDVGHCIALTFIKPI